MSPNMPENKAVTAEAAAIASSQPTGRRLHILHVFKVYLPDVDGGIPTAIRSLTAGLADRCQSAVLATRRWGSPRNVVVDGIPVRRSLAWATLLSLPLAPFYPLRLFTWARTADVVSLHAPFPLADLLVALCFPKHCALVVHWHSEIVKQNVLLPLVGPFIRRTLARANRIIVSSAPLIQHSQFLRPLVDKCVVVPFGTDLAYWTKLSPQEHERVAALRAQYPRLVITTGRLVPYKGIEVLIEAFAAVNGQCVIIGEGHLEALLRRKAAALGVEDRVHLIGRADDSELKCLLHAAQVFALPSVSRAETFGIAQMEAMACGTPVVNTDLPTGVPWVARHGHEGLTVPPRQPKALAQALNTLLDDGALRARLAAGAAARALELFDERQFIERTFLVYKKAVADQAAHHRSAR